METTIDEFASCAEQPSTSTHDRRHDGHFFEFFEAMLHDGKEVDDMVCDDTRLVTTLQKLLAIAVFGLVAYGLVLGAMLQVSGVDSLWFIPVEGTPVLWVPLALTGGFLTAMAVCLPSFYFYTLLSGLDASFRLVTAQSLRVQARSSVLLLGVLPFYLAIGLTPFLGIEVMLTQLGFVLAIGLILPFLVGFGGLVSVYASFRRLIKRLPLTHSRRGNFVLRMVACWAAVMASVAPVAVVRFATYFSTVI